MKRCFLLLFIISIFLGCASQLKTKVITSPVWVSTGRHPKYPASFYLSAAGASQSSSQEADDIARKELSKEIQVHLKGVDESSIMETVKNGRVVSSSDIKSGLAVSVDITLEGITIADRWFDSSNGRYHSIAVLNRDSAADNLGVKISGLQRSKTMHYSEGEGFEQKKDYLPALRQYISAYNDAKRLIPLLTLRGGIIGDWSDLEKKKDSGKTISDIEARINGLISNIEVVKSSGDNQTVRLNAALKKPLQVKVIYKEKDGGETPVSGMPLRVTLQNSETVNKITASENGMAEISISDIRSPEGMVTAVFEPDISSIMSDYLYAEEVLHPLKTISQRFQIVVVDNNYKEKLYSKREGITVLALEILDKLDQKIKLAVTDFTELRTGNRLNFSKVIESGIKTALLQVNGAPVEVIDIKSDDADLPLYEKVGKAGINYALTGGYTIDTNTVRIEGRVIDITSRAIMAAGGVTINRDDITAADIATEGGETDKDYFAAAEDILKSKPTESGKKVSVWADKAEYSIGDKIRLNFKADHDCYITLIDIGTSGDTTILFPNSFYKDSLIKGGVTYTVPEDNYGFDINVEGPPGVERIKAVCADKPLDIKQKDARIFNKIPHNDSVHLRNLSLSIKALKGEGWSEGYTELFITPEEGKYYKGSREIKIKPPVKPIDIIGTKGAIEEKKIITE